MSQVEEKTSWQLNGAFSTLKTIFLDLKVPKLFHCNQNNLIRTKKFCIDERSICNHMTVTTFRVVKLFSIFNKSKKRKEMKPP